MNFLNSLYKYNSANTGDVGEPMNNPSFWSKYWPLQENDTNSTEMITNSINPFLFIDSLKFSSLIHLKTSVITSCLGKDGYMSDVSKLIKCIFDKSNKSSDKSDKSYIFDTSDKSFSRGLDLRSWFLPYEKGISQKLKRVANKYGLEVIFTRSLSLKSKLRTNPVKSDSACGVVYKGTCSCC